MSCKPRAHASTGEHCRHACLGLSHPMYPNALKVNQENKRGTRSRAVAGIFAFASTCRVPYSHSWLYLLRALISGTFSRRDGWRCWGRKEKMQETCTSPPMFHSMPGVAVCSLRRLQFRLDLDARFRTKLRTWYAKVFSRDPRVRRARCGIPASAPFFTSWKFSFIASIKNTEENMQYPKRRPHICART